MDQVQIKVTYDKTQLMKCAQYIFSNNPSAFHWGYSSFVELGQHILELALKGAQHNAYLLRKGDVNDLVTSNATGGYHISYQVEDNFTTIVIEFLIDPAVSLDPNQHNYVTEDLI